MMGKEATCSCAVPVVRETGALQAQAGADRPGNSRFPELMFANAPQAHSIT